MWWFFPYFDVNQPRVYMCPPILSSPSTHLTTPSLWVVPKHQALSALLNASALNRHCLENSTDRGAWLSIVHRVAENQIRLSN